MYYLNHKYLIYIFHSKISVIPNVQVACRVRPVLNTDTGNICVQVQNNTCTVFNESNQQFFAFDRVYGPEVSQEELFDLAKPVIDSALQGINATIFSFGATCAGKSYTIFGPDDGRAGIIPRTIKYIFDFIERYSNEQNHFMLSISFLEIYLERVRDLLDQKKKDLPVFDSGTPVPDATEIQVRSIQQITKLIDEANAFKVMAPNKINQQSSRSHCILVLNIICRNSQKSSVRVSKLFLADLAGSEKVQRTEARGLRLSEAKNINRSLLALGKVVNSLTTNQQHVPYRDSKLTRILKCSLGGNSKTLLIVHIAPTEDSVQESLSTLLFASRARSVKNKAEVNEYFDQLGETKLVEELIRAREVIKLLNKHEPVDKKLLEVYCQKRSDHEFLLQLGANAPSRPIGGDDDAAQLFTSDRAPKWLTDEHFRYKQDAEALRELTRAQDEPFYQLHDVCAAQQTVFGLLQTRSVHLLEEKLGECEALDEDEAGLTPIAFAVNIRFFQAVSVLVEAGFQLHEGLLELLIQQMNSCVDEATQADFIDALKIIAADSVDEPALQLLINQRNDSDFGVFVLRLVCQAAKEQLIASCAAYGMGNSLAALMGMLPTPEAVKMAAIAAIQHGHVELLKQLLPPDAIVDDDVVRCAATQRSPEAFAVVCGQRTFSDELQAEIASGASAVICAVMAESQRISAAAVRAALARGSGDVFDALKPVDFKIQKIQLEALARLHGRGSDFFELVATHEERDGALEDFEEAVEEGGIEARHRGITARLPRSGANYVELMYARGKTWQDAETAIRIVGNKGLDLTRIRRLCELRGETAWIKVIDGKK